VEEEIPQFPEYLHDHMDVYPSRRLVKISDDELEGKKKKVKKWKVKKLMS